MPYLSQVIKRIAFLALFLSIFHWSFAQFTPIGSGGYTTVFPGVDEAGRNAIPSGTPQISGVALGKPIPTNDWWSALIKNDHANNLFNYPMALKTVNEGLIINYIVPSSGVNGSSQPNDDTTPILVGVENLNSTKATVSDYSDWTVTANWQSGTQEFTATIGIAMPFVYFTKDNDDIARVEVNEGSVTIDNEVLIITDSRGGSDYAIYAPNGSTWSQTGNVYTSNLNGKNYWSLAFIPSSAPSVSQGATEYKKYAYVFPANTTVDWTYLSGSSKLETTFTVTPDIKEGVETKVLLGLLPHQWDNLSLSSPQPNGYSFSSIRGEVKTIEGNSFIVENDFYGILPTLPYLANYSEGFSPAELNAKVELIANDGLSSWTDSYNEGQMMNRMIQTARIADQTGNLTARDKMIQTIKERLEDWLKAEAGEVAFLFYYNTDWTTMIGYPAGHGQDSNINDHHFHWGYFIHAAAFMEQFEPGWASEWGDMINLLVRDAASYDRNDTEFPFLRNFSPYAGHSWANGFATFPFGNDQESSSESMQFAASLIHWGSVTKKDQIRDLGIYIYTTEQSAAEEYWFDINERTFKPEYGFSLASRIWGNGYDNQTFFTSDIAAAYGIEMYPIHGGSLYLGRNKTYVQKLWSEIEANTGILSNEENPNLWHDMMWKYLSFIDPVKAIELYDSYPDRNLKFGTSDAQTYHWLHSMNGLGSLNSTITADYPIAAVFEKGADKIYVGHNYDDTERTITFSDGYQLVVPPNQLATSVDISLTGTLTSSFTSAYANGSVELTVVTDGGTADKVEFYDGSTFIGQVDTEPFTFKATNLSLGVHEFYGKVFQAADFAVTNIVSVAVGEQTAFLGSPNVIPGSIEAGNYDKFEGGVGQNIAYVDVSQNNEGGYRPAEYVDALDDNVEGATVGWIAGGEWLEYTIDVQTAGVYDLVFRFASGNANGGGPFFFEIDGEPISPEFSVTSTGDWDSWESKTVTGIELNKGMHILRLTFVSGEFNIGRMTFEYNSPLSYSPPVAHAGENVTVILPESSATLDGSLSSDPEGQTLTYLWEQVYGPSLITFNDITAVSPLVSNLEAGIYKCKLTVNDGTYSSTSDVLIIVSLTGNVEPSITLISPEQNDSFREGSSVVISASASDLDGTIQKVEFYDKDIKIGESLTEPYTMEWLDPAVGAHELTAKATDDLGGVGVSQIINITVDEVKVCSTTSTEALEGSFSIGYKTTYETVGNDLTIYFELLDTEKVGTVAFLRQETPFSEVQMDQVSANVFTKTIKGFKPGAEVSYACKFAYSGGLSVTKYVPYVIGSDCSESIDVEAPTGFTASIGAVTMSSIELVLNATDNSGRVVYDIVTGGNTISKAGDSGAQQIVLINTLTPETEYSFSISVRDLAGNISTNSPISLSATTTVDTNTDCSGSSSISQIGSFDIGYTYDFETDGTDVNIIFEFLDQKDGVFAFLWQETPFVETQMTRVAGNKFTATLSDQTKGATIRIACKFEFAGGLAVTKYFSYEVGDFCDKVLGLENGLTNHFEVYPNPAKDILSINGNQFFDATLLDFAGRHVLRTQKQDILVSDLPQGLYMLIIRSRDNRREQFRVVID
jgi:endo-1,3(4)-beta-glucanase